MNEKDTSSKKKNIYSNVTISVKDLNKALIVMFIALGFVIFLLSSKPGLTVSFDTNGGSRIEDATYMYGDYVIEPEKPVKEGYTFVGWYQDPNGKYIWNFDENVVESTCTLYAFWTEK